MKLKRIGAKLILGILPVVVIAMAVLTVISARSGREIITEQMQERMVSELEAQKATIAGELELIKSTTVNLSNTVNNGYKTITPSALESTISQVVGGNDMILGSGVWFEANVYRTNEKYYAPYVHSSTPGLAATYYEEGSGASDYFSRDFYMMSKEMQGEYLFAEPYYDAESGEFIMTCVSPMINSRGNYIGCVTVDVNMMMLQNMISGIQIGETGDALLLSGNTGAYLGCTDESRIQSGMSILNEENASLAAAGQQMMDAESGIADYSEGGANCRLYYGTVPEVNWKIAMRVPQLELDAPVTLLVSRLLLVCAAAIVVAVIAILIQVRSISRGIRKVHHFAETLASGDFSIEPMSIRRIDELGQMGRSLNAMYESNREVISDISTYAGEITDSSGKVNASAENLMQQFETIVTLMNSVNEAMMSASAATQEVNASTEEVSSSVNILAGEAEKSKGMTEEIKKRANQIEKSSRASYDNATRLSKKYEDNLTKSLENAEVVESIGKMAEMISGIAQQINLLSLNASIEAARAGEQGRGFAVVATEIGKMAGETAEVVEDIQNTIEEVKKAFEMLAGDSKSLIGFLKETVTPDYDRFVGVAKQYGEDAVAIEGNSIKISEMAASIEGIMGEVANAVQNIAESTQSTADTSTQIMDTVDDVSKVVEDVSEKAREQEGIAGSLNAVVGKFKLN